MTAKAAWTAALAIHLKLPEDDEQQHFSHEKPVTLSFGAVATISVQASCHCCEGSLLSASSWVSGMSSMLLQRYETS
jgi:hypothetical protein